MSATALRGRTSTNGTQHSANCGQAEDRRALLRHGYTTHRVTIDIEGLPGVRMAHLAYYRDLNALNADYAPVALPDSARAPSEAFALATLREHYPAAVTK